MRHKFYTSFLLFIFLPIYLFSQATLPHNRTAWGVEPAGWTNSGCVLRSSTFACSGSDATTFDGTGDRRILNIASAPNQLTFKLKRASMSGESSLLVEESADNITYTTLGRYGTAAGATAITDCADISLSLNCSTRFIRWTYTKANGNCDLDDVSVTSGTPCVICTPAAQPTTNASAITITPSCTFVNLSFTAGNGSNRIIVMSQTCPLGAVPLDQTAYTAGSFGAGSTIGAGNFVVFNGTASSATITGLTAGTSYCFSIFEYNGTSANCTENYLTAGVVSTSFTTNSSGCTSTSGGLVVNEFSNGASGSREYMEFLVIGDPCTTVDLRGWIFDDNSGIDNASCDGFSTDDCDVGIAPGHARFRNIARWAAVPVGSIILIYNSLDKNTSITIADDPTDSNGDLVYVLPINDSGLEGTATLPSSPSNCGTASYIPGNCSFTPVVYATPTDWAKISLNNTRDACQTRRPDGTFFHGFSYGTVNMTGGPFGINFSIAGEGRNFFLNCGHHTLLTDYSTGTAPANETPGAANSALNQELVNYYRGVGGCGVVPPCVTILSVKLHAFNAKKEERSVLLDWQLASSDTEYFTFELQRSADAVDFYTIAVIDGHSSIESYLHYDREPMPKNYYRLKMTDENGEISYSQIRNVNFDSQTDILVYPNPLRGSRQLTVISDTNIETIEIYNALGQRVYSENNPMQQIDLPNEISAGFYTLLIHSGNDTLIRKLVIE